MCSRSRYPRDGLDVAGASLHDLEVAAAEIFPLAYGWLQLIILPVCLRLWVHHVVDHRVRVLQLLVHPRVSTHVARGGDNIQRVQLVRLRVSTRVTRGRAQCPRIAIPTGANTSNLKPRQLFGDPDG
jgi:hypothetical protein